MDKEESHCTSTEHRVCGASRGSAALEGERQRRLNGQESEASESRYGMRALQKRLALHFAENKTTLTSQEEEEESPGHELGVKLPHSLAEGQSIGFTAVAQTDLPAQVASKSRHRSKDCSHGQGMPPMQNSFRSKPSFTRLGEERDPDVRIGLEWLLDGVQG